MVYPFRIETEMFHFIALHVYEESIPYEEPDKALILIA